MFIHVSVGVFKLRWFACPFEVSLVLGCDTYVCRVFWSFRLARQGSSAFLSILTALMGSSDVVVP